VQGQLLELAPGDLLLEPAPGSRLLELACDNLLLALTLETSFKKMLETSVMGLGVPSPGDARCLLLPKPKAFMSVPWTSFCNRLLVICSPRTNSR
jgi:hypothetical protein